MQAIPVIKISGANAFKYGAFIYMMAHIFTYNPNGLKGVKLHCQIAAMIHAIHLARDLGQTP